MKLHPDVIAIRKAAPKRAKWLLVFSDGSSLWAKYRGKGGFWYSGSQDEWICRTGLSKISPASFAADLSNGDVHLQDRDGKITVVPQSVWVEARKRKAGKGKRG